LGFCHQYHMTSSWAWRSCTCMMHLHT
jgi:hypothetical protein